MNYKFISLDISSSNIGVSYFERINQNLILNDIFNLSLNCDIELYKRFDDFEKINMDFDFAILESSLKNFNTGFTNKNAILLINSANQICSYILNKNKKKIYNVHPLSYRASAGIKKCNNDIKSVVLNYVINNSIFKEYLAKNNKSESDIFKQIEITRGKNKGKFKFESGSYDKSDSFVIGYGGEISLIKKGELN